MEILKYKKVKAQGLKSGLHNRIRTAASVPWLRVNSGLVKLSDVGRIVSRKPKDVWVVHGRNGRAFLFSHAMNITLGPKEDRHLLSGLHTVADIYCADCHQVLGWKYERAYEVSQKYKEGKFILEKAKIVKEDW
ncbi:hypothetical protein GOBAR_AA26631 [Gossypium barbadense]|uniref:Protein yippee-like n=1 Tax=Gossypium barbadense TaxID=3634 RepID=A0A2P5WSG0_GOSBA|nr:hypothetical protein GOBAR_AA26631 [Gossypium barbadense]